MLSEAPAIAAMYGLVLLGLTVVAAILAWPSALLLSTDVLPPPVVFALLCAHVASLFRSDLYLYLNRKAFVPVRRILMPLLMVVLKSEARREREATWYVDCKREVGGGGGDPRNGDCLSGLLASMSANVRRDVKKKLMMYMNSGITTRTRHSDYFSLNQFAPLVWDHEKRRLQGTDKSVAEEFIKRFLIILLATDGYIDTYYDEGGRLCALHFIRQQGRVLHSSMYFCAGGESRSGIWVYKHVRSILRGLQLESVNYVNFQVRLSYAKKCAGCLSAHYEDKHLMDVLYECRSGVDPGMQSVKILPDLTESNTVDPVYPRCEPEFEFHFYDQIDEIFSLLLVYAEALMVVLHSWILFGLFLPSLEKVKKQHYVATYAYLVSDMMLPLLATSFSKPQHVPGAFNVLIAAHSILYADFIFDGSRLPSVMSWAYSGWRERMQKDMAPGSAVLLDAVCHLGGLVLLYRLKSPRGKLTAAALGVTIGSLAMISLRN